MIAPEVLESNTNPPVTAEAILEADHGKYGVLIIGCGGTGIEAANKAFALLKDAPITIPLYYVSMDTDSTQKSLAAKPIDIGLDPNQASEVIANASMFSPAVQKALDHIGHLLTSTELGHGARTTPGITQVAMEYHEVSIIRGFRTAIDHLKEQCRVIRVYIIHSTSGGTGRAASVLLPLRFADTLFANKILYGFDGIILEPPILISGYPFAHARHNATELQAIKILSNHIGWTRETDKLLRKGLIGDPVHIGYANDVAVNSTAERLIDCMAEQTYNTIINFPYIKARKVDSQQSATTPLRLVEKPEDRFPSGADLRRSFYPQG